MGGFFLRFSVEVESQMFTTVKLAKITGAGEACSGLAARQSSRAARAALNPGGSRHLAWAIVNRFNRPVRTRMLGGVGGDRS